MVVRRENYINIQGWMVTDLGLKGNNLLIYAIIYGFSQEDGQRFTGSLQYLADWTNSTKQGIQKNLKQLSEAKLIAKEEIFKNGIKFVSYYATELYRGMQQSFTGHATELHGGMQQSCSNNKDIYSTDNLPDKDSGPDKPATRSRFVKPTLEEITAYCKERKNNIDPERFKDYYDSNGWKVGRNPMKDWKATVRNWEKGNKKKSTSEPIDYGDPMDFYR